MIMLKAYEVIRTIDLEPIIIGNDSLQFRIEIQKEFDVVQLHSKGGNTLYRAKVWRTEMFNMNPLYPDSSRLSTENVLVQDDSYTGNVIGYSEHDVLKRVLNKLSEQFGYLI